MMASQSEDPLPSDRHLRPRFRHRPARAGVSQPDEGLLGFAASNGIPDGRCRAVCRGSATCWKATGCRSASLLLLFTSFDVGRDKPEIRCNLSSWYVEPAFRSCASLLVSVALRHKGVTYMNISPAPHTWPIIEAFGFAPFCSGQFTALPWLGRPRPGIRVREVPPGGITEVDLPEAERELVAAHAGYGCLSLVCTAPDGDHPFIFQRFMRWHDRVPCMRLIYCRQVGDLVRFAGPLGRHLLRRGIPLVTLDSNGSVAGLVGIYEDIKGRKYFKGPDKPRLGDLAYTELPLFGP